RALVAGCTNALQKAPSSGRQHLLLPLQHLLRQECDQRWVPASCHADPPSHALAFAYRFGLVRAFEPTLVVVLVRALVVVIIVIAGVFTVAHDDVYSAPGTSARVPTGARG